MPAHVEPLPLCQQRWHDADAAAKDHEARIRELERWRWRTLLLVAAFAGLGGIGGDLLRGALGF